jgi:hypothetical protein
MARLVTPQWTKLILYGINIDMGMQLRKVQVNKKKGKS